MRETPRAQYTATSLRARATLFVAAMILANLLSLGRAFASPVVASSGPASGHSEQVLVAPGVNFALQAPAALARSVEASQFVTAHYQNGTYDFETRISVSPARMLIVGTDLMGRRAMTINWTGTELTVEAAPWLPSVLRARNVLADIMLLHWPAAVVRDGVAPPASFRQPTSGQRVVTVDGRDVIRIDRLTGTPGSWNGRWSYRNAAWGYDLDIQSTELAAP